MEIVIKEILRKEFVQQLELKINEIKHQVNGIEDHLENRTFSGIFEHRVRINMLLDELDNMLKEEIKIST